MASFINFLLLASQGALNHTSNFLDIFTNERQDKSQVVNASWNHILNDEFLWMVSEKTETNAIIKATPGHEPCGKLYV